MDASKIFTVLCAFLLVICLTLSVTALVVMRHTVSESESWQGRAEIMVGKLDELLSDAEPSDTSTSVTPETEPPSTEVDVLYQRFCMRDVGGRIGIYTEDGYLVRVLDVATKALPTSEQAALTDGIWVNSWRELNERIQDYE